MNNLIRVFFFVFFISLVLSSCGDSSGDYREQWVGTYTGTKSNSSFEDTMFTADISFDVVIDENSTDGLIVNGINFPISEEGTFGPDFLDDGSDNYELSISGDELRLASFGSIPNGIVLPCYIMATKQ
jgi:hypothetical protein